MNFGVFVRNGIPLTSAGWMLRASVGFAGQPFGTVCGAR